MSSLLTEAEATFGLCSLGAVRHWGIPGCHFTGCYPQVIWDAVAFALGIFGILS